MRWLLLYSSNVQVPLIALCNMQAVNLQVKILVEQPLKAEKCTTTLKKKTLHETMRIMSRLREATEREKEKEQNKSEKNHQKETRNYSKLGASRLAMSHKAARTKATLHFCLPSRALNKLWTNLHLLQLRQQQHPRTHTPTRTHTYKETLLFQTSPP